MLVASPATKASLGVRPFSLDRPTRPRQGVASRRRCHHALAITDTGDQPARAAVVPPALAWPSTSQIPRRPRRTGTFLIEPVAAAEGLTLSPASPCRNRCGRASGHERRGVAPTRGSGHRLGSQRRSRRHGSLSRPCGGIRRSRTSHRRPLPRSDAADADRRHAGDDVVDTTTPRLPRRSENAAAWAGQPSGVASFATAA